MAHLHHFLFLWITGMFYSFGQTQSENLIIFNDSIELPGVLSYTKPNSSLIIWAHGSGNIDKDGNQGSLIQANYIKQFREAINKNSIAFFSYDKRTANPKNLKSMQHIVFHDLVKDLQTVINYFKEKYNFKEIVVVGHSQGSLLAMLVENIDKYISIAGAATSIDHVLLQQIKTNAPFMVDATEKHLKELKETGKISEVNPMLVSIFAKQNQAFLASWMRYNPSEELKKIKIPILLIHGTKDLQVKLSNAKKLQQANPSAKLIPIENMNHVLKNIVKDEDNMKSYYSSKYPIAQDLIRTITTFMRQ